MAEMVEARGSFWSRWAERVASRSSSYIRPEHPQVKNLADGVCPAKTRYRRAENVWKKVFENTEYEQSNQWKTPDKTIKTNTGDCDDQTFLQTSILANIGIPCSICGGVLTFPDGSTENHVWNEVDGRIVDATAEPHEISHLTYTTYARVDIIPKCQS